MVRDLFNGLAKCQDFANAYCLRDPIAKDFLVIHAARSTYPIFGIREQVLILMVR